MQCGKFKYAKEQTLHGFVKCLVASFLILKCYSACLLSQHDLQHSWIVFFKGIQMHEYQKYLQILGTASLRSAFGIKQPFPANEFLKLQE